MGDTVTMKNPTKDTLPYTVGGVDFALKPGAQGVPKAHVEHVARQLGVQGVAVAEGGSVKGKAKAAARKTKLKK